MAQTIGWIVVCLLITVVAVILYYTQRDVWRAQKIVRGLRFDSPVINGDFVRQLVTILLQDGLPIEGTWAIWRFAQTVRQVVAIPEKSAQEVILPEDRGEDWYSIISISHGVVKKISPKFTISACYLVGSFVGYDDTSIKVFWFDGKVLTEYNPKDHLRQATKFLGLLCDDGQIELIVARTTPTMESHSDIYYYLPPSSTEAKKVIVAGDITDSRVKGDGWSSWTLRVETPTMFRHLISRALEVK